MCEPKRAFEYALKMVNPARLTDFKTVNVRGTKHCTSLQELQDFIGSSLPASITTPDLDVVAMRYIESGHGTKARKVWLLGDEELSQMYECNEKKKKILLWCYTEAKKKKHRNNRAQRKTKRQGYDELRITASSLS